MFKLIAGTIAVVVLLVAALVVGLKGETCPEGKTYGVVGSGTSFNGKTTSVTTLYGCK